MPQFDVHRNPNVATQGVFPLLLDVQADLMSQLETRVVVPLRPVAALKDRVIDTLMPIMEIEGERYAMVTPQLAGISRAQLGSKVAEVPQHRDAVIAALDLLVTGI
jgi:toxin CcdB